jgi:cobaltochelatase CobN
MPDLGLILACRGCCCGHPDRGGAMAPPRVMKSTTRRLHKVSGLADRLRLAFSDCLGPCSEANVMLLYLRGRPLWSRRMNAPERVEELLAYAREIVEGGAPPLPAALAARSFSRTGGGLGPDPPIADAEATEGMA